MPQVLRVSPELPDPAVIREAADMIRRGLVVAYPTDTLYGLAVDPRNAGAVQRLYELKGRAETSALTLIAADLTHVRAAGEMTPEAERLAARWWPGPLTIVVRARGILAREMLAGGPTVGIRIPDHAVAIALAHDAGFPITATSANRSGATAASNAAAIEAALPDVDAIVDGGATRGGAPSTIVDASVTPVSLLREGVVPWAKVLRSLQ
jgi:tRNA threonylcarbamoyl adenosine modification protein (Sua5/YciO/YrdC/YwlC family)